VIFAKEQLRRIERVVLGIFLRHPESALATTLRGEHFRGPFHRRTLQAIRDLLASGEALDIERLAERLGGGDATLGRLADLWRNESGALDNLGWYENILREDYKREAFLRTLRASLLALEGGGGDVEELRSGLITELARLDADGGQDRACTAEQMMRETIESIEAAYQSKRSGTTPCVPTGISKIDGPFGGLHPTDLIVIGGRPGTGKTALMLSMAATAARAGRKVGIFSSEMDRTQIGQRLVAMQTGIPASDLRVGNLDDASGDFKRIASASSALAALPFLVDDTPSLTMSHIALRSRFWQASQGLDAVFVDYLQRVQPSRQKETRTLEVGQVAIELKNLARTLGIPVVALAQLNRQSAERIDKRPHIGDLRDSGMIEQEADQVFLLYRESVYDANADPRSAEIIVDKNRHGSCAVLKCEFDPERMLWRSESESAAPARRGADDGAAGAARWIRTWDWRQAICEEDAG
jgi:replicative DNA helicase